MKIGKLELKERSQFVRLIQERVADKYDEVLSTGAALMIAASILTLAGVEE